MTIAENKSFWVNNEHSRWLKDSDTVNMSKNNKSR